jgi:FkbM family methyltransferase
MSPIAATATDAERRAEDLAVRRGLLWWLPPSVSAYVYTVLLKAPPLRRLAHAAVKTIIPERVNIGGVTLALNKNDAIVSGSLALGCYETFNLEHFIRLLEPGLIVLDVGANIGLYSAVAARHVGESGRVIAVEPDETNCRFIERTRSINTFSNLQVVQAAAGDRDGSGTLYLNPVNLADHRIHDSAGTRPGVPVRLVTIDTLVSDLYLPRVDLIKIDTQGAEAKVLRGMTRTLATPGITIILEFWPWGIRSAGDDPASVLELVRAAGFAIHEIDGDKRTIVRLEQPERLLALSLERQHTDLLLVRADA